MEDSRDEAGLRKELNDFNFRQDCVERAIEDVEAGILALKDLEGGEAVDLGFLVGAYRLEWLYCRYHIESAEAQISGGGIGEFAEENLRSLKDTRMEVEGVLFQAQRGNFRDYKSWLLGYGEELEGMYEQSDHVEYGRRAQIITGNMPDHGAPIRLPSPAWMDPRYNGERASQ